MPFNPDKIVLRMIESGGVEQSAKHLYQPRLKEKATLLPRCSAHNDGEFVTFIITPELIEKVFFS